MGRTVSSTLAAASEPLTHNLILASFIYRYYFGRCSFGRSTCSFNRFHDVTTPKCYKDVYVNNFFLHKCRLWIFFCTECSHLSYDLHGFKSGVNRHQQSLEILISFLEMLFIFFFLFLQTACLVVGFQLCIECIPI